MTGITTTERADASRTAVSFGAFGPVQEKAFPGAHFVVESMLGGETPMPEHKKGFTLVEMLIVISLIVFLASLTFWTLQQAKAGIREKTTLALVTQVSSSIREFHSLYLIWPPDPENLDAKKGEWGLPAETTWYEFMNHEYVKSKKNDQPVFEARGPWLEIENRFIDENGDIVDVWGNPVFIDVDAATNAVLVYSYGPDGESDNGCYEGDGEDHSGLTPPIDDIPAP